MVYDDVSSMQKEISTIGTVNSIVINNMFPRRMEARNIPCVGEQAKHHTGFSTGLKNECLLEGLKYSKTSKQQPFETPGSWLFAF